MKFLIASPGPIPFTHGIKHIEMIAFSQILGAHGSATIFQCSDKFFDYSTSAFAPIDNERNINTS